VSSIEILLLLIIARGNYDFRARQPPVNFPKPPAAAACSRRKILADE
jgi:hypothetical protein